jgi:outer membrane receptor protein involved in Fe transport
MNKLLISFLLMLAPYANAQTISGIIKHESEFIADAQITTNTEVSTNSNADGKFLLNVKEGKHIIKITAVGYITQTIETSIANGENKIINIALEERKKELRVITVSGSRFAKRAAEEVVSIEVIKPNFIKNAGLNTADEALNKLPGVDVIDNQINIRGGSGWSYGAGSRVMILLNDIPMLTADASDAKWDFMPIENCEQIEVLKGAASSLYGSSALNGVVNFRTAYAKNKPSTKIQLFSGLFGNPARKEMIWWENKQPQFQGGYVSHAQKFDNVDFVIGSAWYAEDSYLQGDATRRARLNTNLRITNKKIKGLSYGLHTNLQFGKSSSFFLHQADTTFANLLRPYGGTADSTTSLNKNQGRRFNIDPYISYTSNKGNQYNLRTRVFNSNNYIPEKKQSSNATSYYAEAQFAKKYNREKGLLKNLNITTGLVGIYNTIIGDLYGKHNTSNIAPYVQLEKKLGPIWLASGARLENNTTDGKAKEQKPVFRLGANYAVGQATNLRANWGQGYRYATVAEKYVATSFGAASVFPNPGLKSETGNSKEIGIKQGLVFGRWLGFADAAIFRMKYKNMMEFNFGYNPPPDSIITGNQLAWVGFQSRNIGDTKITGVDISLMAQNTSGKIKQNLMAGYTYILPVSANPDSAIMANFSGDRNILKYRYQHSAKLSYECNYKKWGIGLINTFNSKMVNIDEVFENSKPTVNFFGVLFEAGTKLPSTISRYRARYNKPILLSDVRLSYQINQTLKAAIIVKNVLNTEYYERPALINAPRNFTLQMSADF